MGLVKTLLKAIIIPVVLFLVIVAIAIFFLVRHKKHKKEDQTFENYYASQPPPFPPPPITQWGTGPQPSSPFVRVQKPETVVYPMQMQYPVDAVRQV